MWHQCSRSVPPAGEASWSPADADIRALEAALPAALTRLSDAERSELTNVPVGWFRQYVGIVRGGRRFIYGNFMPASEQAQMADRHDDSWQTRALIVCDGGPRFFGVEFDVDAGAFTHVDTNGFLG